MIFTSEESSLSSCPWPTPVRLFPAKLVRKIALNIHGSQKKMETRVWQEYERKMKIYQSYQTKQQQVRTWGPLNPMPPPQSPRRALLQSPFDTTSLDQYQFVGSRMFPSLGLNTIELRKSFWCLGCQRSYLDGQRLSSFGGSRVYNEFEHASMKAWSKKEFLEHIETCRKAKELWAKFSWD